MLKKKIIEVTPESKILGANIHVEAQQSQFVEMKQEVHYAISQRNEAIEELNKEVDSLQAQLAHKRSLVDSAEVHNGVDYAFIGQLNKLLGS